MGSRPRLSADAAFAAYWNPGLAPGGLSFNNPGPRQCCDFGESGVAAAALSPGCEPGVVWILRCRSRVGGDFVASSRNTLPLQNDAKHDPHSPALFSRVQPVGRVEDWRVDYRVRWLFRRFRFGPQSGSLITFPVPALRTGRAVFPHLGSPVRSCVSHTGPRSHPWTTPMGLALVPYSIHCRSRVAARPVDALTTPSSSDDPFTFACDASGVSGPLPGFQAFATPGTLPLRSPLLT